MISSSSPRSIAAVHWILRCAVALQCMGYAWWLAWVKATPLMSWLWGQADVGGLGLAEATAQAIQNGLAVFLVAAALVTLVRPSRVLLAGVALFQIMFTIAMWQTGDDFPLDLFGWELTSPLVAALAHLFPFATQAGRIALPLVLLVLVGRRRGLASDRGWSRAAEWIARIAVALTFAGHGVEALQHYAPFADMLIITSRYTMPESVAMQLLTVIGTIDVVLAVLVVATRWQGVAWYMAAWGLITALARIVVFGWSGGWYHFAIRASHFALPIVLALWWRLAHQGGREVESETDAG